VIGAGTMGSGIAAHLANCGISTLLLDIVPRALTEEHRAAGLDADSPKFRNSIAQNAIQTMPKARLCPLYDPASVVGNQGRNFCLGADLKEVVGLARMGTPDTLNRYLDQLQSASLALRYCHVPTVAAVHGMVLGGGCEFVMHCDRILAAPETYIGLVEPAVGLIPVGGDCKEWTLRCHDWVQGLGGVNPFAFMNRIVDMLGQAKRSGSAAEAKNLGYRIRSTYGGRTVRPRNAAPYTA